MTEFVLKTAAQIGKMVDTAIKHTLKGDALIHEAAVQCIAHAEKHGDVTLLDRLIKGVGRSIRVEGLKVWTAEFTPIRWNGDGKVGMLKKGQKGFVPFDIPKAETTPFWALAAADERTARPLTIEAMLRVVHGMKGRLEKAVKEGNFEGDKAKATAFVTSIESFADGLVTKLEIRDGSYDPNDPENAQGLSGTSAPITTKEAGVPAPAPAPRRERAKKAA